MIHKDDEECQTCLGTKVVEDTKHSLSLGYGGFKPCPACQPKQSSDTPSQPEETE